MKRRRFERWVAHALGWHTPSCLLTTDPRKGKPGWASPECQGPEGSVGRISWWLGWHRWVNRDGSPVR